VHSPRAATVLSRVLKAHPAPQLRVMGISQAALRPLARARLAGKAAAPLPDEASLLNLLERQS
jgi:uroporphyrinogen-III synthase